MMKIVRAMNDDRFSQFYGDYQKICVEYDMIKTGSTRDVREKDKKRILQFHNLLVLYGFLVCKNPWETVQRAYALKDDVDMEAKRRGIA